jgi:hypothetical protein
MFGFYWTYLASDRRVKLFEMQLEALTLTL